VMGIPRPGAYSERGFGGQRKKSHPPKFSRSYKRKIKTPP